MKALLPAILLLIITSNLLSQNIAIDKKVPNYTFTEILNQDKNPFNVNNQTKPIIIEFWATWCAPCIPAMIKLESIQNKYQSKIEILTVSSDSKKNLYKYIKHTNTKLKIAFDTSHLVIFNYKQIPHTILIDKMGYVKAIITPNQLTDKIINDLIIGNDIELKDVPATSMTSNFKLNKSFKNKNYQFKLTSENKNLRFKNKIKRDANDIPIALEFNNVSLYRLLSDIYQLSSVARIYAKDEISIYDKYCFQLDQSIDYKENLLDHAKIILNNNLDISAQIIEKTLDSVFVLEVLDKSKLPIKSERKEIYYEFRGPYYKGEKINSYHLIKYLENEIQLPVKDKTQMDYNFDLELEWEYANSKTLIEALKAYGLILKRSEIPESIQLLEIKQ